MTEVLDTGTPGSSPGPAGVGEVLARARCSIGLSIEDVAQKLKYSVRMLDALEKGRVAELPGGVFARGLVRSYARLVKLDPEPLVGGLAESATAVPVIDDAVSFRKPIPFANGSRRGRLGYALVMLAALAVIGAVLVEWPREPVAPAAVTFAPPVRAPFDLPAQGPAADAPAPSADSPLAAVATPGVASDAAPASSGAARGGVRRLTLRFEGPSWVEVRAGDGRILVSELQQPGTMRSLEGVRPFSLVIGNARKVRLDYDEQPVDLAPHTRLDVARLTLE